MMGRPTMFPFIPLGVPGSPVIVPIPVVANRKLNHRDAKARCVAIERNIAVLIVIREIRRVHPSAHVFIRHITPAPIIQAAYDSNRRASVELRNLRIAVIRSRIHANGCSRHRLLRRGGGGQRQYASPQHEARQK
jgi:hypothetical protein